MTKQNNFNFNYDDEIKNINIKKGIQNNKKGIVFQMILK